MQKRTYRGMAPATTDVLGGQTNLIIGGLLALAPHIRSGKLKAIAVVTPKRAALAPQIPTVAESGLPGFEIVSWYGLLAPAGTPQAVVDRLHRDVAAALRSPDVKERLVTQGGLELIGSSPAEFAATIAREIPQYERLLTSSPA